ncbi:MAG: PAS domain-containing protein [Desulfobacteraceae bacterium]|jgi:sensor histidine kinase regulating citrate/malate metabolism
MNEKKEENQLVEMVTLAVECMGVAVTIIDTKGTLLYYNKHAAQILDRKPEYIGKDAHSHHKKAATNKKFDLMLQDFEEGRTEPFHYEAKPYGKIIIVTLSPIIKDKRFVGCVQSVQLKEEVVPEE